MFQTLPLSLSLSLLIVAGGASIVFAHGPEGPDTTSDTEDVVVVYGRSLALIGEAGAASEGVVGYADFEDRPLLRVGELVEVIPGVIATQHSGEGKANQYFLRGFNLDHGTDFSANIDGAPINLRTHGHGQGYLDLNFIIPELVERVDFRKGPYRASTGDFSSAGSARYSTADRLDRDFVDLTVGEYGYLRGVAAGDLQLSDNTNLILAVEGQKSDGPWKLEQDLKKINATAKIVHDAGPWHIEGILNAYDSEWVSSDQAPLRAIDGGLIDRFGFIDDDLGGETSRYGVNANATYSHNDGAETAISAYALAYDFSLFSNFTYFLNDPVNGDEFEQIDERSYYGASLSHSRDINDRLSLNLGGEFRFDDISDVGLFNTAARERLSTIRRDRVEELSFSLWGEAEYAMTEGLRATVGLRGDYYDASVDAISDPRNSGSANDSLLSPSAGLALEAAVGIELYANYGHGFHSNDVRGATIAFDPVSGAPVDTLPILVQSKGTEIGARFDRGSIHATLSAFKLDLDSELVFVGDAGATEVNDGSSRTGVEVSMFWQPNDWLTADVSAAYTDAELDIAGTATEIPNAVETVIGGGLLARWDDWTASARLRHLGKAPLIEDGSVSSKPTTLVNLSGSYDWRDITLSLELLNAFNSKDADITYFYESQLLGETAAVEDIHLHPVEPRQFRASVRYHF